MDFLKFRLNRERTGYVVVGCDKTVTGDLEIPSVYNGKPVTSIGHSAFGDCTGLTSITIPDSVTYIESWTFRGCTGLTSVTIPDSVTSIGEATFFGCKSLTSVAIGNGVTNIGCSAFDSCTSLTSINVDASSKFYSSLNGVLFNKNKTELRQYPIGKTDIQYTIPDSVTRIGSNVFYDCKNLTSITIPDSVTSIGSFAFYGCENLTSVTIPDSVARVDCYVFAGCPNLEQVTILKSDGIKEIYAVPDEEFVYTLLHRE